MTVHTRKYFVMLTKMLEVALTFVTRFLEELTPWFLMASDGGRNRRRSREHLRVLDRCLVVNRVRVDQREAFDDMGAVGEEIPGAVKPHHAVLVGDVEDQRVPVPAASG